MYNGEDIRRRQLELKNNLLKGFGVGIDEVDENEFEKAHKQGDLHPNGKWYGESSAAGGKGDWRTIGGRRHKASQGTQSKGDGNNWNKELNSEISKLGKRLGVAVKNNEDTKEIEKEISLKLKEATEHELSSTLSALKSKQNPTAKIALKLVENEVNDRSKSKKDSESNLTKLNDILSKLKNGDTSVRKLLDTKEKAFLKKLGFELDERIGRGLLAVKSKEPWKLANEIESYMSKNNESQKGEKKEFKLSSEAKKVMNALAAINSKYSDPSKVTVEATDKGNWRLYYDGKDTGTTVNGKLLSDDTIMEMGWEHHDVYDTSLNNETKKEDLRAAREKLGYLQDNEERLIKRDGKEKYDKRLKQAKEEVAKLKSNKEPEKKVYDVTLGWNKKDQSTYNQIDKITDILEERGELSDWPFRSISQAQKRISFSEASNIISALKRGERIKIYI